MAAVMHEHCTTALVVHAILHLGEGRGGVGEFIFTA